VAGRALPRRRAGAVPPPTRRRTVGPGAAAPEAGRGLPGAGPGRTGRGAATGRGWVGPGTVAGRGRDRGSASIEFLGFLPVLILVALAAVQLGIAAYAAQQAGTAARAAARTASLDDPRMSPQAAGKAAMSGWLADGASIGGGGCGGGEARATATVEIPSVIPGFDFGSAERSATMPCAEGDGADGGTGGMRGTGDAGAAAMGGGR
ncbi:TadE/TadG family type IV pilus assembly protein, partial [Streptomyces hygroscopicus]|uniref:TadE/TadG family type IV pilus assembly protein n=1 Tax=Streptomyces hygroscopicus TaxID=1912 RepID=UPI003626DADF